MNRFSFSLREASVLYLSTHLWPHSSAACTSGFGCVGSTVLHWLESTVIIRSAAAHPVLKTEKQGHVQPNACTSDDHYVTMPEESNKRLRKTTHLQKTDTKSSPYDG